MKYCECAMPGALVFKILANNLPRDTGIAKVAVEARRGAATTACGVVWYWL